MNLKKIVILLFFCFILCGCDITVNIKFSNQKINEEIMFDYYFTNSESQEYADNVFGKYIPAYTIYEYLEVENNEKKDGVLYYNREKSNIGNGYHYNYSYQFGIEDYYKSFSTDTGLGYFFAGCSDDSTFEIATYSPQLKIYKLSDEVNNVTVNITPSYEVVYSNADKVENGTYTWYFTRETEKEIELYVNNYAYCHGEVDSNELPKDKNNPNIIGIKDEEKPEDEYNSRPNTSEDKEEKKNSVFLITLLVLSMITLFIIGIFYISYVNATRKK